jgi:MoaA/NifB/PqqE/SkfB family radical SAM enzyme
MAENEEKKSNNYGFENPVYVETKNELDKVGKGMCLAKWTQVTMHLQNGHNHSCHHPRTHKISESEIKRNPSALHNTRHKKLRRKEMLNGSRPEECDYCWGVEDNSDRFSDRIFKSAESWSKPFYNEIVNSDYREDFNPRYVEVAFSNTCNFKCSYCGPAFSTLWMEETEQFGGYKTSTNFNDPVWLTREEKTPIKQSEHNPYTEAFWS